MKKFDVKRLPLKKQKTKWVSEDELEDRMKANSVDVVETREVTDHTDDSAAHEQEGMAGAVMESTTPDDLRQLVELLGSTLDLSQQPDESPDVDELAGSVRNVSEDFDQLVSQLNRLRGTESLPDVLSVMEGLQSQISSLVEEGQLPTAVLDPLQKFVDSRDEVRSEMLSTVQHGSFTPSDEMDEETREQWNEVVEKNAVEREPGGVDDVKQHLSGLIERETGVTVNTQLEDGKTNTGKYDQSLPEEDNLEQWIQHLREAIREKEGELPEELERKLIETIQQSIQSRSTGNNEQSSQRSEPGGSREEDVKLEEALRKVAEGQWEQGLGDVDRALASEQNVDSDNPGFESNLEDLEDIKKDREQFMGHVDEQLGEGVDSNVFREMIEGDAPVDVQAWVDSELTDEDLNRFRELIENYEEWKQQVWEQLRSLIKELLESVDTDPGGDLEEMLMNVADQVHVQPGRKGRKNEEESWREADVERHEVIRTALENEETETLSRQTGLPETTIESVKTMFIIPEDLNKWQNQLIEQFNEIFETELFLSVADWNMIENYVSRVEQLLDSQKKPLNLVAMNPDPSEYVLVHQYNTSIIALLLARYFNLNDREKARLVLASALFDTGLCAIPKSMFMNDDDLTRRGRSEVHKHPLYSEMYAERNFGNNSAVARLVREHHERIDGSGYPDGLEENKQHEFTPMLSVADVYTAMLEGRFHRDSLKPLQALEQLNANQKFSSKVVGVLKQTIGYYPNGTVVLLDTGELGLVRRQVPGSPREPKLLIFTDEERDKLDVPQPCNLGENNSVGIRKVLKMKTED